MAVDRCGDCGNNIALRKNMEYSSKGGTGVCLKLWDLGRFIGREDISIRSLLGKYNFGVKKIK